MNLVKKNFFFREINLFHFTSFFGLDFLKFSGPLCSGRNYNYYMDCRYFYIYRDFDYLYISDGSVVPGQLKNGFMASWSWLFFIICQSFSIFDDFSKFHYTSAADPSLNNKYILITITSFIFLIQNFFKDFLHSCFRFGITKNFINIDSISSAFVIIIFFRTNTGFYSTTSNEGVDWFLRITESLDLKKFTQPSYTFLK